ncbi:MAG TPA: Gfo/Idh/MocA family oxidoreductase, partial [Pseudolysinimonas sp.]|nr:Gfo/Idh/MocA family oxidoreductase [Pseudolysinimonas sp.]
MSGGPVGVGFIGAGMISSEYLRNLTRFPDVEVRFVSDIDLDRAAAQAREFGIAGHGTVDELLARDDIEIVVNLTIPAAHAEVGRQVLAAGKHVWSEKPFALDRATGQALLAEAERRGLRAACAPDTFLGAGLQSAQRLIRAGEIGRPVSAIAFMQQAGPDRWHPNA